MSTLHRFQFLSVSVFVLFFFLSACGGGGGGGTPPPPASGTISGTVAGTEIIAVDDAGDIVATDDTAGKTPDPVTGNYSFTLTGIPTGTNIRVYLVTGSGVFPMYFDSDGDGTPDTNVFSLSGSVDIDLGFVDTTVAGQPGKAIPDNDPSDLAEVGAGTEISDIPATASVVGTWGYGRLKHRNSGTWAVQSGIFTYNADGTGTTVWQENDDSTLASNSFTWTWVAVKNTDGSITITRTFPDSSTKVRRVVISDDNMAMILDGTQNLDNQRFRVSVRMDPNRVYSDADLNDTYYILEYFAFNNGFDIDHGAISGEWTPDGAGNFSTAFTNNTNGFIGNAVGIGTYAVSADGALARENSVDPVDSYLSSDAGLLTGASSFNIPDWNPWVGMKKADRAYTTADIAGSWAFVVFGDSNGTSFFSEIGTMTCVSNGECTSGFKQQRDGALRVGANPPSSISIRADGSFGPLGNEYAAAIGNDGNMFIMNVSFDPDDMSSRGIVIGVRCSACTDLEGAGQPVPAGGTLTVNVSNETDWSGLASATVIVDHTIDGRQVGTTDAQGSVNFTLPSGGPVTVTIGKIDHELATYVDINASVINVVLSDLTLNAYVQGTTTNFTGPGGFVEPAVMGDGNWWESCPYPDCHDLDEVPAGDYRMAIELPNRLYAYSAFDFGTGGTPINFAVATGVGPLTDGETLTVDLTFPVTAPATTSTSGTVTAPTNMGTIQNIAVLGLKELGNYQGGLIVGFSPPDTVSPYAYTLTTFAYAGGSSEDIVVVAEGVSGSESAAIRRGTGFGGTGLDVSLIDVPTDLSPTGGCGSLAPTLSWTGVAGAQLYVVNLEGMPSDWEVIIDASSTSFVLPNLSGTDLASLGLASGVPVNWFVQAVLISDYNFNTVTERTARATMTDFSFSPDVICTP